MPFSPTSVALLYESAYTYEVNAGADCDLSLDTQLGRVQRTYTRTFIVTLGDFRYGPGVAIQSIYHKFGVEPGAVYVRDFESDTEAYCTSVKAGLAGDDPNAWRVVATYQTLDPDAVELFEDPIQTPIKINWSSATFEKIVDRTIADGSYANGRAIVNSAGDPFDPPVTRDDSRPVLTVVRNELAFDNDYAESFRDHVNASTWNGYAARTVKIASITADLSWSPVVLALYPTSRGYYWTTTYVFHIDTATWDKKILDAGYHTKTGGTKGRIILDDGSSPAQPVPLDGSGATAAPDNSGNIVGVYLPFQVYEAANFAALNITLPT